MNDYNLDERIESAFEETLNESIDFKNFAKLAKLLDKEDGRIGDDMIFTIIMYGDSAGGSEEYAIGNAEPELKKILKSAGFKNYKIKDSDAREITQDDDNFEVTFKIELY